MKNKKVAVYTRISTSSDGQLTSYSNQEDFFIEYIEKQDNRELYKVYGDLGTTGTKLSRDGFNEMLYDAGIDIKIVKHGNQKKLSYFSSDRKPKFDYIYVKNTSRFARNVLSEEILRELRNKSVYVYFMDINKSTEEMGDSLIIQIFQIFDENESRDKSVKVSFGLKQAAKKGVISSNVYGYKLIKGDKAINNKLVINEDEAKIVREIFNLYATGIGIRKVEDKLRNDGVKGKYGKPICRTSIRRILDNEKYTGTLVRNKYYTGTVLVDKHYPKLRPKEEWIYHEDANIEPIISKELFYKCKDLKESKTAYMNKAGKNMGKTIFAQMLVCSKCGSYYIKNADRGRGFYNCGKKKRYGKVECDNRNISETVLKRKIRDYINKENKVDMKTEYYIGILNKYIEYLNDKINVDEDIIVKEKTEYMEKLEKRLERMKELYIDGDIDKDEYLVKKDELVENIEKVKFEILNIDQYNKQYRTEKETADEIIDDLKKFDIALINNKETFYDKIQFIIINEDLSLDFEFAIKKQQKEFIDKALEILHS